MNAPVLHRKQGEPSQNNGDATNPACEPPGEDGPPQPSLNHKVRFVTGKGLGLLFHSRPLDKWIGRDVTYEEATGRLWETLGEYLSDEMAESYAAYRGRLRKRHALGKAADKLVKITDKYLPRITDEARVYIMKFPHKIPVLLKQARKVQKKAKSRAAQGGRKSFSARDKTAEPAVRSGPSTSSRATPSNLDPQTSGGRLDGERDVTTPHDLPDLPDLEAEVDWRGTSSEASDSRADSQAPLEGDVPALQSPSRGMTRPRTTSRSPTRSSSHLGGMRPRTPSRSPRRSLTRNSSHLGRMRPRTPSRSPRRNVRLVPNQHWRNVQEVQAHMARSRSTRPS